MQRARFEALLVGALMAVAAPAVAQPSPSAGRATPKWDAAAGFGLLLSGQSRATTPAGDLVVDLGRYWTTHLKTTVQLSNAGRADNLYESDYRFTPFPSPSQTYTARETQTSARPAVVSAGVTYQFYENVFAHPFVSGGVRLAWLSTTTTTSTHLSGPPYSTLSSTSTSGTTFDIRPTAAVGAKTYFANGRLFMRPEVLLVVDREGTPRAMVRVLVGSDF
jgi:hypothetical protein